MHARPNRSRQPRSSQWTVAGLRVSAAARRMVAGAVVLLGARPVTANAQQLKPAAQALVVDEVTVVDVERGQLLPAQRVVVEGNRIRAVGSARKVKIPRGARVVVARDQYLLPGLWDMHAHNADRKVLAAINTDSTAGIDGPQARILDRYASYIAYGVTGVRDMYTLIPFDSLRPWRRQVAAGTRVGPRVVSAGRYIDSQKDPRVAFPATTVAEAVRAVDSLKAMGADFVKIHEWGRDNLQRMPLEIYFALAAEARRLHIPFGGHTPVNVTIAQASDSGQRSLEHADLFQDLCKKTDSAGQRECAAIVAKLLKNNTWLSPNFVTRELDTLLVHNVRRFGNPFIVGTDWPLFGTSRDVSSDSMGSGAPVGVHRELARLVKGGLTPAEALQAATINPAKSLEAADSLGTVAAGKVADLVLLDADPLTDIRNTLRIQAVVANGRYFNRAALDSLIADIRAKADQEEP